MAFPLRFLVTEAGLLRQFWQDRGRWAIWREKERFSGEVGTGSLKKTHQKITIGGPVAIQIETGGSNGGF
jgi:hypothetical protein